MQAHRGLRESSQCVSRWTLPVQSTKEILHMEPGTVMKEAKAHMISRPSDEGYYVSETEIATRVTRYTEFENTKHNKRGPDIHETE